MIKKKTKHLPRFIIELLILFQYLLPYKEADGVAL